MKNILYNNPSTLCWNCKNTNRFKCSWFDPKNPKPVDGWTAVRRDTFAGKRQVESYHVISCPNYVPEDPRPDHAYRNDIPQCWKTGVIWRDGKWQATISKNGKHYYLGMYKTMEEAIAVREEAERRLADD